MSDPRLYRAALVPVLFALVLLAFSLENHPRPLTTTLAPDAFAGDRAFARAYGPGGSLADRFADRRPGSPGDQRLARLVERELRATSGFRVRTIVHDGQTIDGRRALRTVIAERTGTVDERIVVVAHRDAAGHRAEAELSATAVLLELARVFGAPRQTQRTLTLVSTSGGSGGAVSAAALADDLGGPVAGVLVLGDLASRTTRPPLLATWSNDLGATPLRLRSTLQEALRQETGTNARLPRALTQFARFAMPATYGEQGALLAHGLPAVLLSIGGDRPPAARAPISRARLETMGRVALRTVTALDAAPRGRPVSPQASSRDLATSRKVLPGWAVRLFIGSLLLAPLVVAVDALAAVRRTREPIFAWVRWTLAGALPLAVAGLFAIALGAVGLLSAAPDAPIDPRSLPVQLPALLAVVLVLVLGWVWLRPAVLRLTGATFDGDRASDPSTPAAAAVVLLVALVAVTIVWLGNPYAAAALVPGLHIWVFALAPSLRIRAVARVGLVALSVVPVAIVAAVVAGALGLGALSAAWEALLLVAGGHVSLLSLALWSLLAGCVAGALIVAAHAGLPDDGTDAPITVRGPRTYAGPGSLGGTESALKR
jgi:hypothetical protein